jgi:hypothetical protein
MAIPGGSEMRRLKLTVQTAALCLLSLLSACQRDGDMNVRKTAFPGEISAGGGTSGEAIARAKSGNAGAGSAATATAPGTPAAPASPASPAATTPSTAPAAKEQMPSGTPGIPQGNEGNTGGVALGGTTSAAAVTKAAPGAAPDPAAAKAKAEAQAALEKQQLAESMEKVSAYWRKQAAANRWETHPPVPVAAAQGFDASATQSSASGQPGGRQGAAAAQAPIRSEKAGTAQPSKDAKPDNPRSIQVPGDQADQKTPQQGK